MSMYGFVIFAAAADPFACKLDSILSSFGQARWMQPKHWNQLISQIVSLVDSLNFIFCMTDFVQQTLNSRYKKFDGIKAALNNRKMDTRG